MTVAVRRWQSGWTQKVGGLWFRVRPGKKAPKAGNGTDLVLEWRVAGEWIPIPMAAAAVIADFWHENEDVLYPPDAGFKGGGKFIEYLHIAVDAGWQEAEKLLQAEKAAVVDESSFDRLVW